MTPYEQRGGHKPAAPKPDPSASIKIDIPLAPPWHYRDQKDFKWLPVLVTGMTGVSDYTVKLPSGREQFIAVEDFEALQPMVAPKPDPAIAELVGRLNAYTRDWRERAGSNAVVFDAIAALDASRAETAAANARAEALSVRCADLSDDLRGEEMVRRFIEAKLAKAVEALRRLDEATAISTNSGSADRAFSFVHAVAATALTEIEGKSP